MSSALIGSFDRVYIVCVVALERTVLQVTGCILVDEKCQAAQTTFVFPSQIFLLYMPGGNQAKFLSSKR